MKLLAVFQWSAVTAALILLVGTPPAGADPPSDVSDLVGARGAGGETELGQRGYEYVTMSHGTQYWWNAERQACVGIKVAQGRYQSVTAAAASKCHQSAKAEPSGSAVSSKSVNACKSAVNRNFAGKAKISVTRSEFSQANSLVMMRVNGTENWKCLVSNNGHVEDLSIVDH